MINDPVINTENCSNCGTQLIDKYCHKCGQKKIELKDRTVKAFAAHFFEEFLTFDSKFFRSLKYLILKPGFLTHEYISGRFVHYISPVKMYLFTSLVVFFILTRTDPDTYKSFMEPPDKDNYSQAIIDDIRESKGMSEEEFRDKFNPIVNDYMTIGIFFIMIAFSLVLKLIYINKHIYYVEHLVFTLHFFSMVLIFIVIGTISEKLDLNIDTIIYFIVPCIYLLLAIKRVYHLKWIYAFISGTIMSLVYWVLLIAWTIGIIISAALRV
jgi:uncharacterized protein DUF3667